jgi:hypothetical protein
MKLSSGYINILLLILTMLARNYGSFIVGIDDPGKTP